MSELDETAGALAARLARARARPDRRRAAARSRRRRARAVEALGRLSVAIAAERDRDRLPQLVVDAATELVGAAFGAFLHGGPAGAGISGPRAVSGVPRGALAGFPPTWAPHLIAPILRGEGVVRAADIAQDPRGGRSPAGRGAPEASPPVRSYLAAPVVARSGEVIGGLFFGHPEPGAFGELEEQLAVGLAAQAAVAIENAELHRAARQELAERRRAEGALRESEARYRALTEMSPDAVYVHRDGAIILANARAAALLGAAGPEELIGRSVFALIDGSSLETARSRTARLQTPGDRNEPTRLVMRRLDGRRVAVEASSAAVLLDGRLAVQAVLRDVTAQEAAAVALRESEEQRRLALEAAGLGVWDVDYATGKATFDRRFRALHGLDPEAEIPGEALWALIHPSDVDRVRAAVARAKDPASDGAYEVEYRAVLPDGRTRWHLAKAQVHFEGEGAARRPARFLGVVMDVTERKRAEAALRESEARYRATQEHAGVGIGEIDAAGRFLRVNAALCAIAGYSKTELLGRSVFDVTHPEDAKAERAAYARLVAGEADTYAREKRYLRKDGSECWVEVAASAVRDDQGRFLYGVRVVQDVTERKVADARLRLLLAELSHRVKNTLAVVQSLANHSLAGDRPLEEGREVLAQRLRALARAHELLTASAWRGASLRELAAAAFAPYRGRVAARGEDLALGPQATQSLALIFHELATNAAKHGALSAPEGRVEVTWAADGPDWRLVWRESGGPAVRPPARRGFGRLLVEGAAAHELGGRARLDFRPEGLVYELEAPLARLAAR